MDVMAKPSNKKPHVSQPSPKEDGTRDRILRTAERLFAERGFSNVSVRELAGEAKVNIALIGYHFTSKEGLLSEVYRRHCEPMIEERLREEAVRTCIQLLLDVFTFGANALAIRVDSRVDPKLRKRTL